MTKPLAQEAQELSRTVRERAEAATPGPWLSVSDCDRSAIRFGNEWREIVVESENHHYPEGFGGVVHAWDAAFISSARTDVPALCNMIDRLVAEIGGKDE